MDRWARRQLLSFEDEVKLWKGLEGNCAAMSSRADNSIYGNLEALVPWDRDFEMKMYRYMAWSGDEMWTWKNPYTFLS